MSQETINDIDVKADAAKNIRSFKTSTEVESFYRFINDNDLKREAGIMLKIINTGLKRMKKKRIPSRNIH